MLLLVVLLLVVVVLVAAVAFTVVVAVDKGLWPSGVYRPRRSRSRAAVATAVVDRTAAAAFDCTTDIRDRDGCGRGVV